MPRLCYFNAFSTTSLLNDLMRAIPNIVLILNGKRQIVFANERLLDHLQLHDVREAVGQRPGKLFNCTHAFETEGSCGTYSIKLLTKHYLHGKVAFRSKAGEGTTFFVTYPLHPPA